MTKPTPQDVVVNHQVPCFPPIAYGTVKPKDNWDDPSRYDSASSPAPRYGEFRANGLYLTEGALMQSAGGNSGMLWLINPAALPRDATYPDAFKRYISRKRFRVARNEITSWPGYQPTPIVPLNSLAASLGIASIFYKDEGDRFGLGSFKALGGAYAAGRAILRHLQREGRADLGASLADIRRKPLVSEMSRLTLVTATDGNHGRAVAWGARTFGCKALVFLHCHVSAAREEAIRALGAQTVRIDGNYDDSVRAAAESGQNRDHLVISDTSYKGYTDTPADVMQGYTVMVEECLEAMSDLPTHVFVQAGVGALAAAAAGHLWETLGPNRPRIIVVESSVADCLYQSAAAGMPVAVSGDHNTIMAGLACGEVSDIAWRILHRSADAFVAIEDVFAREAVRALYAPRPGDPSIISGESGAAGLGGLLASARDPELRSLIGLERCSRVLLLGTERDTDPESFRSIVVDLLESD